MDSDEKDNYLKYKPKGCGQRKRVQKRKRIESEQPQQKGKAEEAKAETQRPKRQRQNDAKKSIEEAAQGVPYEEEAAREERVAQELARQHEEEKVAQELAKEEGRLKVIFQELSR